LANVLFHFENRQILLPHPEKGRISYMFRHVKGAIITQSAAEAALALRGA
jgi:hypothetical protein